MLNRILLMVTVLALVVLCVGGWRYLDYPVQRFVISGDLTKAEQDLLTKMLGEQQFEGILSTDLEEVADTVQAVNWTRDVTVRREWPDRLVITLIKQRPVARWSPAQYVSTSGELLDMPDAYPGLPTFSTQLSDPKKAMEVYRLISQVTSRAGLKVQRLEENAQGEWEVSFNDGLRLAVGSEHLSDRLQRFLAVYRRVLIDSERPASYADARYTNGVAVRFLETATEDEVLVADIGASPKDSLKRGRD